MEFKNIGDTISVAEYNALIYLLRKFKRLTTTLQIGNSNITSDFGNYHFTPGFKSFGANWIITDDVTVTSNNVLKNCYYSFIFTVIDVNLSGDINRRVVTVDSESTGDAGTLEVTIPEDLIAENEVILPDFNVEVIFDEHEYYTPLPDVQFDISINKRIISSGESNVITGVLSQKGEPLVNKRINLNVDGTIHELITDSQGKVTYTYIGTGTKGKVVVSAFNQSAYFYDGLVGVLGATFTGNSVSFGQNIMSNGDVIVDWGDGTTQTINNPKSNISHTYTDGLSEHTIIVTGNITSLGYGCFALCDGLTSVVIPDSVTSLGGSCFRYCYGLTSVVIPDSVTIIGSDCFRSCSGLTSVVIPDSVTSLGGSCFINCSGLTSVTIPESVISLGNDCFRFCSGLIDYELYWTNEDIITYDSNKMPNNTNTFFYIPIGTKQAYINKNYPSNKLVERGYKLTVTGDKNIIQSTESATVTALLVNNEQPVSDETLSYTVKHGTTTIDSGTITTGSDGTATVVYTGTAIGQVDVIISYGTLLQETYEVLDCIAVDNATDSDHNDSIWSAVNRFNRGTDYTTFTHTALATTYISISDDVCIEFDIQSDTNYSNSNLLSIRQDNTVLLQTTRSGLNISANDFSHIKIEINNNQCTITNTDNGRIVTGDVTDFNRFYFRISANESIQFKNLKIYSI